MSEEMEMPRSHMPNQVVSQNIFFKVWYLASQERFCGLLSILTFPWLARKVPIPNRNRTLIFGL